MTFQRATGWKPDAPDAEDFRFGFASGTTVPWSLELDHLLPPVMDQGMDESCVEQAIMAAIWGAHVRQGEARPELASRKALWWPVRKAYGLENSNVGSSLREGFVQLNRRGFQRERFWPHERHFTSKPSPAAMRLAADQRNRDEGRVVYRRLAAPYGPAFRVAIASGFPVVFGVRIGADFAANRIDPLVALPPPLVDVGGHAMVAYGYSGEAYRIRNSWGPSFGDDGSCLFSRAYVEETVDAWIVASAPLFSDAA